MTGAKQNDPPMLFHLDQERAALVGEAGEDVQLRVRIDGAEFTAVVERGRVVEITAEVLHREKVPGG